MSYTTSAAWSRPVLSLCCTEHGPYRGAVLSDRITSVSMSKSSQLGRRYTVAVCISAGASVTHERALETCEPSTCLGQLSISLFLWFTTHWGLGDMWQHRSSPLRKAEPGDPPPLRKTEPETLRHVAAPELTSVRR
jgi:hypothetical protein